MIGFQNTTHQHCFWVMRKGPAIQQPLHPTAHTIQHKQHHELRISFWKKQNNCDLSFLVVVLFRNEDLTMKPTLLVPRQHQQHHGGHYTYYIHADSTCKVHFQKKKKRKENIFSKWYERTEQRIFFFFDYYRCCESPARRPLLSVPRTEVWRR